MIISFILFEDENDAITFHKEWFENNLNNLTGHGKLVSSYKFPSKFCNELEPFVHKRDGWTYLKKRGWWVCPICKRPSKSSAQVLDFSQSNYGTNILEKIKNAKLNEVL